MYLFFADMSLESESEIHELRDHRTVPLPYLSYDSHRGRQTPIVIDNGGQEVRAGWAGDREPSLTFRSVLAKTRRDKTKESELLVGSDITNIEAVRHALRSPFDKNVVTHLEAAEHLLDHTFSHLSIDTLDALEHPVLVTEAPGQPNMSRHLYSQLLFELYSVPGVGYGIDSLFSLGHNLPGVKDALLVSLGHHTVHIIPVLDGQPVLDKARRLNIGGAHMIHHLQKTLQLKYQNHVNTINLSRAEEMFINHTKVVTDFFDELRLWGKSDHYDSHVVKVQLPFTVQVRPPPADPEVLKAKRQELAKRLVDLNARKRSERLLVDEAALRQMLIVKEYHDQGNNSKFSRGLAKLNLSLTDISQLEQHIEKLKNKIERAREAKARHDQGIKEEKVEPEVKKRREDMSDQERNEFDDWISEVRKQLNAIRDKKQARLHRRQQMAKRRTAASQERMRIISQLAKNTKKDDTFGMNDDDWDVYKQISVDGGDSDSEEENLRSAEYEAILKEHDPQDDEVGRENPEWHQIHLAAETIRTSEILFQPSILGHDQAGLGELIEFVLGKFPPDVSDRLANNVFVTGGLAKLRGLKERMEAELQIMRPFQSTFKVTIADDPVLDSWRGASQAAASDYDSELFLSRKDYFECGEGYLREHFYSNKYFPTPSPSEKLEFISNPTTPSVKEEVSCPATPMQMVDSSNPPSPFGLVI